MSVKKIEETIRQFFADMPDGLRDLPEQTKQKMKDHLSSTLNRMDVVTREEFEVQKAVLLKTREKVEALEHKLSDDE